MGICFTRIKRETLEKVPSSFWVIEVPKSDGSTMSMGQYKEKKALVIVNVNEKSKGNEKSFDELNHLSDKYKYLF